MAILSLVSYLRDPCRRYDRDRGHRSEYGRRCRLSGSRSALLSANRCAIQTDCATYLLPPTQQSEIIDVGDIKQTEQLTEQDLDLIQDVDIYENQEPEIVEDINDNHININILN